MARCRAFRDILAGLDRGAPDAVLAEGYATVSILQKATQKRADSIHR